MAKNKFCRTGVGRNVFRRLSIKPAKELKRIGNLFEKVCSIENLYEADRKARKGKRRSHGVIVHDMNRDDNLRKLHDDLMIGRFKTSKYSIFKIHEPKERIIYRLPYYPDRIVHHAIMNVLEPIWTSVFTTDTYSCIKKRGIHAAAKKLKKSLQDDPEGTKYCLKLDIKKFYPSVNHDILKSVIRKKIKDKRLLSLLDEIIDSAPGIPIGNYLSQYLSNLFLSYFDHWIKEEKHVRYYFRYADDIVVLGKDKHLLKSLFIDIRNRISDLDLVVKDNWQIFPVESRGIDFLGYVFYHTHTRLRKSIKKNFFRYVGMICRSKMTNEEAMKIICGWVGWSTHCDSVNLLRKIFTTMAKKGYYWIPQEDNTENGTQFFQANVVGDVYFDFKENMIHVSLDRYFPVGSVFHFTGNCTEYYIKSRKRIPGLFFIACRSDGCQLTSEDVDIFSSGRTLRRTGFAHSM